MFLTLTDITFAHMLCALFVHTLIHLLPPGPGLSPDQKSAPTPMPLQQLGLFQPGAGAKDEEM